MARKNEVVLAGNPMLPGVTKVAEGYNFTVQVPEETEASLLIYKKKGKKPIREISLTDRFRNGEICSVLLPDFPAEKYEYNYKIGENIVQDPYACRICGRDTFGHVSDENDEHEIRCGFLSEEEFEWDGDRPLKQPYENMVLYKLHVRGFTKQAKLPAKLKGTFAGLKEMIPYLKQLGVNAVELMPVYEFAERPVPEKLTALVQERHELKNTNYWGYLSGSYFAPKKSYCATDIPENEVRDLIKTLHREGIECILEMYFPKEIKPMMVLHVLQFWKMYYHVDGFHLLGEGVPKNLVIQDDLLKGTKIMADWFSEEEQKKATGKTKILADYNMNFLENMRRFLKSDAGVSEQAMKVLRENYEKKTAIHYMACQDGFTMNDMVSYNEKHNEENGHGNRDGLEYNFSWNCGEEGTATRKSVQELREKQIRNAFFMLLLSQGVPMIYAGDEFGNSQSGNNNAYCQDNPTGWLDWKDLKKHAELYHFVEDVIAFRKEHPILHMSSELKGSDYKMKGLPDISFHGMKAWECNFDDYNRLFGVMYCGDYAKREDGTSDDMIFIGYNFHWGSRELALPDPGKGRKWKKIADTSKGFKKKTFEESAEKFEKKIEVEPRTIVVLIGKQEA